MMWHTIYTLKPGGQLVLKVRIFKRCETLGLVSILSCLFDDVKMVNSTTVAATLVAVIFTGMTGDNDFRVRVGSIIKDCMGQHPEKIFMNPLQDTHPRYRETLRLCVVHRDEMNERKAKVNTIFLVGLYCMREIMNQGTGRSKKRSSPIEKHLRKLKELLDEHYGPSTGAAFFKTFLAVEANLSGVKRQVLLSVLNSQWMDFNF
jgi:hypothetical protein